MAFEESRDLIEAVRSMDASQKSTFVTWLVITLIRDISYYVVVGILVFTLGRRLIQACLTAFRETRRESA